jgi:hypothetical protein
MNEKSEAAKEAGVFNVGDPIRWKNLFGIWQSGKVERSLDFGVVGVRRYAPEDSEGLPNDEIIWLNPARMEHAEPVIRHAAGLIERIHHFTV